jgi:hypothetical protein
VGGFHIMQIPILVLNNLHGFVHGRKNFASYVDSALHYVVSHRANVSNDVISEPVQSVLQGVASPNGSGNGGVSVGIRKDVRPSGNRLRVALHVTTGAGNPYAKTRRFA